jgi:polyisoprenoid-binding protein YceI
MNTRRGLNIFSAVLVFGLVAVFSVSAYAAETYKLEPELTSIVFRAKYQGVTFAYGRFNGPTGAFVFDESTPANSSIEVQLKAKDVDTAVDKRDKHLKSPDFFDVAEHPLVSFKSTSIKKISTDAYQVTGDLTLLGKSRSITVNANHTGSTKDPWGNFLRAFETSFAIKRSEFGMNFMLDGVDDEVMLTVSVTGIRQ